jgi:hypothetical protein
MERNRLMLSLPALNRFEIIHDEIVPHARFQAILTRLRLTTSGQTAAATEHAPEGQKRQAA